MACPMNVAKNAPTIPSTVVKIKPLGLFGPGDSSRASIPATKPTMMIQRMPLMVCRPFLASGHVARGQRSPQSKPVGNFVFVRKPAIRRQVIDGLGQILAEALKQFVARHPALRG